MGKNRSQKLQILKIKSAISQFLINTQKIVKSVKPDAEIRLANPIQKKRKIPSKKQILETSEIKILTPNYRSKSYLDRNQKK